MLVDLADQDNMVQQEALVNGVPNIRFLHASRTIRGPQDVEKWIEPMLKELTRPLTEKEKEKGMWNPPQPRVLFTGTLDEAEKFYQQTKYIPHPVNANLSVYTDGFPITIPPKNG